MQTGTDYLTCTEAAKLFPGRPSANCIWRWCRRGVAARNGERVRLRHVRLGGRLLTTRQWLDMFGHALAAADTKFFDAVAGTRSHAEQNGAAASTRRAKELERIDRDLDEAGL